MIQFWVCENFEAGADGSAFGVIGTIDEPRNSGVDHRTRTHTARLDGDIQSRASQPVIPQNASRLANDDDFRMRGRVTIANGPIAAASYNSIFVHQERADGDFACRARIPGLLDGKLHERKVR